MSLHFIVDRHDNTLKCSYRVTAECANKSIGCLLYS